MKLRWIRTGMQVGQAIKNVQRLRTIIGVFAKNGFLDLVDRMNLGKFIPSRWAAYAKSHADKSIPERLRESFEELGPTFVKLGQLLSTRPDLIPESFIEEFTRLQDNVPPLEFEVVRGVVERELGRKLDEAFAQFDPKPLAAASIGQVHDAVLPGGEKVVVKVQRPDIDRLVDTDVSLLSFLAALLDKYVPEIKSFNPKVIVEEFARSLNYELDFVLEANNMSRIAQNLASIPDVVIPKVYRSHTTRRILTLEKIEGIRVNDAKALDSAGIDRKQVVTVGAKAFFKMVMLDGLFHGDLHGGNLFILPGNRVAMVDFGMVGRLSEKFRGYLANMMISLITEDYENLCYIYAELSVSDKIIDLDGFQREVRNMIAPYMGLSLADINSGRILMEASKIGSKYNVQVPGEWMLVFKAILTMDGMGRTLDPTFDLLSLGQDMVRDLVKNQYSPQKMKRDLMWIAKDATALLQVLPRQIRWMLRKFASNDYALEIKAPGLDAIRRQLDTNGRRMSLTFLAVGLFIASSLTLQFTGGRMIGDYPVLSVAYFGAGVILLLRLFVLRGR